MTSQQKMIAYPDRREWALDGHEVTCIRIDYRFGFDCWWYVKDPDHENLLSVTIGTPFMLELPSGTVECTPEDTGTLISRRYNGGRLF